ncbi:hypothetical protein [Caldimonas brevitalea]|uniref:hypothetical protein n=1 Tax=Caldimonas brevitalea TaxID=413882 RepID=UPI0012F7C6E6|nr:hypothetical protein [Caldimonas brevitalea]
MDHSDLAAASRLSGRLTRRRRRPFPLQSNDVRESWMRIAAPGLVEPVLLGASAHKMATTR